MFVVETTILYSNIYTGGVLVFVTLLALQIFAAQEHDCPFLVTKRRSHEQNVRVPNPLLMGVGEVMTVYWVLGILPVY